MGPEKSGFFTLETGLSPETGLWEKQDFPPSLVTMWNDDPKNHGKKMTIHILVLIHIHMCVCISFPEVTVILILEILKYPSPEHEAVTVWLK